MTGYNELVDRYVALWNETDPSLRRKAVEELWAEDGVYVNEPRECRGHDAIAEQVAYAHQEYIGRGFTFRSCNNATGHHDAARFNWVMLSRETGQLESVGFDFLVLDGEGRIRYDYQFIDKPPSS